MQVKYPLEFLVPVQSFYGYLLKTRTTALWISRNLPIFSFLISPTLGKKYPHSDFGKIGTRKTPNMKLFTQCHSEYSSLTILCWILFDSNFSPEKNQNITTYWLHVLVMSRTHIIVNPHSIVSWMSRNSLLEAGAKSEV